MKYIKQFTNQIFENDSINREFYDYCKDLLQPIIDLGMDIRFSDPSNTGKYMCITLDYNSQFIDMKKSWRSNSTDGDKNVISLLKEYYTYIFHIFETLDMDGHIYTYDPDDRILNIHKNPKDSPPKTTINL